MTRLAYYKCDDTTSGGNVLKNEDVREGWTGISGSDYLRRSGINLDPDDHRVRVAFTANRAGGQALVGQGFGAPYFLQLTGIGTLRIGARDAANSLEYTNLITDIPDGEFVDVECNIRWAADEIVITGFGDSSQYDDTFSVDLLDSPSDTGFFIVGGYGTGGTFPSTDAVVHRVKVTHGSTDILDLDFSKHKTDDQVGSNDLTITGSPTFIGTELNGVDPGTDSVAGLAANSGTALSFDGTANDWANAGDVWDMTDQLTAMLWAHIDASETNGGVIGRWHSSQGWLVLANGGKIRFYRDGSFIETVADYPSVAFHLAVTADGTTGKIYFDGVEQSTTGSINATHTLASGTDAQIASYTSSASAGVNLHGILDEVIVRNDVLSQSEIAAAYNAYFASGATGLITPHVLRSVSREVTRQVSSAGT